MLQPTMYQPTVYEHTAMPLFHRSERRSRSIPSGSIALRTYPADQSFERGSVPENGTNRQDESFRSGISGRLVFPGEFTPIAACQHSSAHQRCTTAES